MLNKKIFRALASVAPSCSWLVPQAPHLHPNPTLGPELSQLPVGSISPGKHKLLARG